MLDANQVLKKTFDEAELSFVGLLVGTATDPQPENNLDAEQCWKRAYDPGTNSIRIARID